MTYVERQYRSTTTRIAICMLFFFALILFQGELQALISMLTVLIPSVASTVAYELCAALLYAATFSIPVFLFRIISSHTVVEPMRLQLSVPRETPLYILFGVAAVSATAYINAFLISFFQPSVGVEEEILGSAAYTTNYELILLFFSLAVVPAFVEEFMFRGMILSNLLPYGRTTAIVGSALLFGLMHQNPQQFFYTTAAGLVLGWVYVRTQSIWPCVLLHFFNNFQSVLRTPISERLPQATADVVIFWMEGVILLLGLVSGVLLILAEKDPRASLKSKGVFEQESDSIEGYTPYTLSVRSRVKYFFNVPMIVFAVLSVLMMLFYGFMLFVVL